VGDVRYTTTSSFGLFYAAWYTVVYQAGRATVPSGSAASRTGPRTCGTQQAARVRQSATQESTTPSGAFPPGVLEAIKPYAQPGFA
jgi:hypothetical protein